MKENLKSNPELNSGANQLPHRLAATPLQNLKRINPTSNLSPQTSHLSPLTSYLFIFLLFSFLPFFTSAQVISNVTVTAPAGFQTWYDQHASNPPPPLSIALAFTVTEGYTAGGTIELPLDFTPNLTSHPTFTYGIDGSGTLEHFFTLDETALGAWIASGDNHAVASYSIADNTLVFTLRASGDAGFSAGVTNMPINFAFNRNWDAKIPQGTVLFTINPVALVDNVQVAGLATPRTVAGAAKNVLKFTEIEELYYYNGGIIQRNRHLQNDYFYETDMDPAFTNIAYIDVPTGSIPANVAYGIDRYFNQTPIINIDGSGYDRYWRIIDPLPSDLNNNDWSNWRYAGQAWSVFNTCNYYFTPPASILEGDFFDIRLGTQYRHANGTVKNTLVTQTFQKRSLNEWEIYLVSMHGTGDNGTRRGVCGLSDGAISINAVRANWYDFPNANSLKNTGTGPITGVSFELYQTSSSSTTPSAKLNYDVVRLGVFRNMAYAAEGYTPAWSRYKVQYEIFDEATGMTLPLLDDIMGIWQPTSVSGATTNIELTLPALTPTQYINKIIAIPMDTDGLSEGVLSAMNGFCLTYTMKAWNGQKWPDGTDVGPFTIVPMGWNFYYDEHPDVAPDPLDDRIRYSLYTYPEDYYTNSDYDSHKGKVHPTTSSTINNSFYTDAPYAVATMTCSEAANALPGDPLNYEIYGSNHNGFVGRHIDGAGFWINPRIMIRATRHMELNALMGASVGANTYLTGTDEATSATFPVLATLEHQDANYNYYSFQAQGYSAPAGDRYNTVFTIPAPFTVMPTARPGSYPIRMLVSHGHPETFYQGTNSLAINGTLGSGDNRANYGLSPDGRYHLMAAVPTGISPCSPLVVNSLFQVAVKTTMSSPVTDNTWVDAAMVPIEPGSTAKMRLTLTNRGTSDVTNIRLYNILPYENDGLEIPPFPVSSTGGITFAGVDVDHTVTIRYTSNSVSELPPYGQHGGSDPDLQATSFWTGGGWSTTPPADLADLTAYFLDFGALELVPGESIVIELSFNVPSGAIEQIAYNQFLYSAREKNSVQQVNLPSTVAGFTTNVIGILYHENLPTHVLTPNGLDNIPDALTACIGFAPAYGPGLNTLAVSDEIPVLSGYTFVKWNTQADGLGTDFDPEEEHEFAGVGILNLYAIWEGNTYTITYHDNFESSTVTITENVTFGENHTLMANPFSHSCHEFINWNTQHDNSGSEFEDEEEFTPWLLTYNLDLYAQWEAEMVTPAVAISANPGFSVCAGTSVTFTATPTNGGGAPSFAWEVNGTSVGSNSATYSYTPANNDEVKVTLTSNSSCVSSTTATDEVTMTVNPATAITAHPSAIADTLCYNSGNFPALSVTATGAGTLTYQWYRNTTATTTGGTEITGAESASYTPSSNFTVGSYYYYCIVTGDCGYVTSNVSGARVIEALTAITAHPSTIADTVCYTIITPFSITPLSITATGTNLEYQWYRNTTASTTGGTLITGAESATYTPPSDLTPGDYYYYCIVTGDCGDVTSNVSGVRVIEALTAITAQPSTTTRELCHESGSFPQLSVTATGAGTLTYQWYRNTTAVASGGTEIPDATSATYTPSSNLTAGSYYFYCIVTSPRCGTATSDVSGVHVITSSMAITAHPSTMPLDPKCQNSGNFPELSVTATGINLEYQWYRNTTASNTGGTLITGAESNTYTPPSSLSAGNYYFYCIITSDCGDVTSNVSGVHGIMNVTPAIAISTPTPTVCEETAVTFTATATNGGTNPTYLWRVNGAESQNGASNTFTYTPNHGDVVTATITSDDPCASPASVTSSGVTLTVLTAPAAPVITTTPLAAYPGESVDLMGAIQAEPDMTYTFYGHADKTDPVAGTIITYNPPKHEYWVAAHNGYCEGEPSLIILHVPCPATIEVVEDGITYEYKVTPLAGLCWTDNMRHKRYPSTGELIPSTQVYTCSGCPANLDAIFGLLYTWDAAMGLAGEYQLNSGSTYVQGICPDEWHIPSQAEWSRLDIFEASQLRSKENLWLDPPGNGTDEFGFDARPAGWYNGAIERFQDLYGFTGWWASDDVPGTPSANAFIIAYYCTQVQGDVKKKIDGLSVRCVMD